MWGRAGGGGEGNKGLAQGIAVAAVDFPAGVAAAVQGFVAGPAGREGGIVNSSRGILFPKDATGTRDAQIWEKAFDAALSQAIDELGQAIQR